ncbi:ATP:cob(I)alamin adenosyltransferase [Candidatus Roizmanbacteria bacterium RIFCSPHIGHO2_02_FULL_37_13b]|uniref:Corrinoid adenosyltransferase n=1 Tax=Candidatus Roizmanbacteria bacterium RIFCSPLOWO2_02_FULL_36_11 TaxID=1802071 RepID=A0A1F7JH49_9BACT|nr:MAG: ATP:cob(I)alamin adenosyltransferase [Candidatus Roizmanbacteria bacterium RIFCSPHIGHO2_02_FULL_37_13b]OGK54939.1 MAG: ATP:cob(I)alamin adenosyltransferase [Candidatus Roizmanbacteria bacterium RIFCSPLOWO2_02_FULL_36_11]
MSIYTKTGDDGTTALFGGKRVKKYDNQIEAYGSVDELSSHIGLVISKLKDKKNKDLLTLIQKDLHTMMGALGGAKTDLEERGKHVAVFEKEIDLIDKKLPKLTRFILPQGGEVASLFHIARTVCRRAERNVVHFFSNNRTIEQSSHKIIVQYLNRLSDFLFMMARLYGKGKEIVT